MRMKLCYVGMEDFSRYLGISRTLALICCILYSSLQADGNSISQTVGSTVTLQCSNQSINCFIQLTWARDEDNLFSFLPKKTSSSSCATLNSSQKTSDSRLRRSPAAASLKLSMSTSESQLYALIIESAQKTHTGNYICETFADSGVFEEKWELIITEEVEDKPHVAAAVNVLRVCFLIFMITATILIGVCKRRSQNTTQSTTATSGAQREHIYENSLNLEARQQ